jgi:Zn-dependent peptidase ImmA (M78 family)
MPILEFVMAHFPELDRKKILNTIGYKVRDLKRKANATEKSTDDSTEKLVYKKDRYVYSFPISFSTKQWKFMSTFQRQILNFF